MLIFVTNALKYLIPLIKLYATKNFQVVFGFQLAIDWLLPINTSPTTHLVWQQN